MKNLKKNICWIIFTMLNMISPTYADVVITELMPCNTSTYINDLYDYVGYAELYNNGSRDVDLKGYSFANDKKNGTNKWTWTINQSCVVKAKQYCMIYFDEVIDRKYHVGYKLDTDGGVLRLMNNNVTLDSVAYIQQYPHLSYGVGSNGVLGYMEPSPMKANTSAYESIKSRCVKPKFSVAPGVKSSAVSLELSSPTDSTTIYYTTNGDIPVVGVSKVYTTPIIIKTSTVVRAIAVKDDLLNSEMSTGSYIYSDAAHDKCDGLTSNVVSIVTDNKFYYDDMQGIYVVGKNGITTRDFSTPRNYAQDWTRAANFEYIVDSSVVLSQEVETNVKGGYSRLYSTKSLGIKSNKKSGKKGFSYDFFQEQYPGKKFESLHLRNGGNANGTARFRDGYMASLAGTLGLDYQAYEPVAAYINGKYMGLMGLRTPSNKSFVKANYGLEEEDIDFIELSGKIECTAGSTVVYDSLMTMLKNNDPESADYYSNASQLMDIDNFIDYAIFEQFVVNCDWPGNNQKLWRERNGGKFKWIIFDLDFGFGLYEDRTTSKPDMNMLKYALGTPKLDWNAGDWMINPFAKLIKNDEFKYRFLIKFMHHLKYSFTESRMDSVWMAMYDKVKSEHCATTGGGDADKIYSAMKTYALKRPTYIYQHLKDYYNAGNKVALQVVVKDEAGVRIPNSKISINNLPLGITDYSVDYFASIPLKVDVKAPTGYKFKKWTYTAKVGDQIDSTSTFEGTLLSDGRLTAVFEKEANPIPLSLQLNEICSSNKSEGGNPDECGHYSDWVEIHNNGTEDVDLAGLFITDDSKDKTKYMFPYGSPETKVEAGGYVIVWADDEPWRGPLHTNFKISASGSFLGLTYNLQNNVSYLDSISIPRLSVNDTYGRNLDGIKWEIFSTKAGKPQVTFRSPNEGSPIVNPQDTIEIVNPQDTIEIVNPQDTIEIVNPQDTIEIVNPQDTIEIVNPQDTIEIVNPQDTIEIVNPQDTIEIVNPQDTIEIVNPQDTIEIVNPQDTIEIVNPQDTIEIVNPQDTIEIVNPQDTIEIVNPQDTIEIVNPQDTIEIVNPQDTTVLDTIISFVDQKTALKEVVVVYPNPAHHEINIETVGDDCQILSFAVYNTQGILICSYSNVNESAYTISTESFATGIYIIRVETNNYAVAHKRFEKR